MKHLTIFFSSACLIFFLVTSCKKLPNDGIPAYIVIDSTEMITAGGEGSALQDFNSLWIETEGENLGPYEIPAIIPALVSGNRKISINAGVFQGGDYYNREIYPAVKPYITTVNFVPGEHLAIEPVFQYYETNTYPLIEDFENGNTFSGYTRTSLTDTNNIEGKCMHFHLTPMDSVISVITTSNVIIPDNSRVYLEIHIKGNNGFGIGVQSIVNNEVAASNFFDAFTPSNQWQKVYYDLTFKLSGYDNNTFNFFIEAFKDSDLTETDVYIDNFKIIVI